MVSTSQPRSNGTNAPLETLRGLLFTTNPPKQYLLLVHIKPICQCYTREQATLRNLIVIPRTLDGLAPSRPSRPSSTDSSLDEGLASGNEQQMGYGNSQVCIAAGHTRRLIFCSSLNLETGPKSCRARCIPPHLGHCLLQTIEDITMDLLEGLYRPFWISRSVP